MGGSGSESQRFLRERRGALLRVCTWAGRDARVRGGGVCVRVRHMQTRRNDLRNYTDMWGSVWCCWFLAKNPHLEFSRPDPNTKRWWFWCNCVRVFHNPFDTNTFCSYTFSEKSVISPDPENCPRRPYRTKHRTLFGLQISAVLEALRISRTTAHLLGTPPLVCVVNHDPLFISWTPRSVVETQSQLDLVETQSQFLFYENVFS